VRSLHGVVVDGDDSSLRLESDHAAPDLSVQMVEEKQI